MYRILLMMLAACTMLLPLRAQEDNAKPPKAAKLIAKAETFRNPERTQLATTFAPGDIIYYRLTTMLPAKAEGRTAGVTLNAKATVSGIKVPYTFHTVLKVPLKDPTDPSNDPAFDGTTEFQDGEIKVPNEMPPATISLKATVRVTSVGAVIARNTVTITR